MNRRSFMKKVGIGSAATVGLAKVDANPPDRSYSGEQPDVNVYYCIHDNRTGESYRLGALLNDGDDVSNAKYIRHLAESLHRSASSILDKSYPDISKSRVYRADSEVI